jgi:hypothetical protein
MNLIVIGKRSRIRFRAPAKLAMLMVFFISVSVSDARNREDMYSVAAIHVHLYYQSTGEIDTRDLLDGKEHNLWNTIAGVGVARKPSCSVLVLVDLVGPTFAKIDGELAMKATAGETTLLERTLQLGDWYADERLVLPFLIYGTGCEKLEISATLQDFPGAKIKVGTLKKSVPFECGD